MPLPTLNLHTFEPTGQTLPVDTYFNPTINTNYPPSIMSRARGGTITLRECLTISKNLVTPDSFEDLLPYISQHRSGNLHRETAAVLRAVYSALPDEHKYLILFTSVVYSSNLYNGRYTYRVGIIYPSEVSFHEVYRELFYRDLVIFEDAHGIIQVSDTALENFKAWLASENICGKIADKFTALADQQFQSSDTFVFGLVSYIYRFASGTNCFYPAGDSGQFSVPFDHTSPAKLANYMQNGHRITITLNAASTKLSFTARPAPGDRRTLERVLNYSANVMDYLPYTIQGPKEPKAVLYGVELEANSDYTPKEIIAAQKDLFFIMKSDASVSGSKGYNYELVTVPASLKAHKRLWAEFFEKVDYQKFDTSKNTGNGMHVHIDRKLFSKSHLNRLTWFITNPANEDFILAVSERPTKRNLDEWARMPAHIHHESKLKAARAATASNAHIRGAVHYKANKTVEIRLFKGIVSYATVVKNLEFVDSVFHFTLVTGLSQLTLRNYLTWLKATPANKYQMLKTFLSEIKLEDLAAGSDIVEYLWNLRAEHIVAAKLNKAPFKVTNAHVTYLNKKRRKRTFILKNGAVICIGSTGGLLAKLDKSIQQKQMRGSATFSMNEFAA